MRRKFSMRGAGSDDFADRRQNYFFFSAGAFSPALAAPFSGSGSGAAFSGALGRGFFACLGSALLALGRGRAFFAGFLLFLDHLDIGGGCFAFHRRRGFLFFRTRHGNGDD